MICTANAPALQTDHLVDFQDSLVESLTDSNSLVDFLRDSLADQLVDSPVDSLAIPLTGSRFEYQRVLMCLPHVSLMYPYVSSSDHSHFLFLLQFLLQSELEELVDIGHSGDRKAVAESPNLQAFPILPSLRCKRFKILTSL